MSDITQINGLNITAATASFVAASAISGSIASASYASTSSIANSASYALTASYALNGGGGGVTLIQASTGINVTNGSGPTVTIEATSTGGTNLGLTYAVSIGYLMP